jgi:hypothetical protein
MKTFILWISMLIFIPSSTAQSMKPIKTVDFSYIFQYNIPVQRYDLEFYPLNEHSERIEFLQIWTGNQYRDLTKCNYAISPLRSSQAISMAKKHSSNLSGKPPIKFKGHILVVYRMNGKRKYQVLNQPRITNVVPEKQLPHARTPPPEIPCEY